MDGGLSVDVEMLHNVPDRVLFGSKGTVYKVIYSLSPPGVLYKDPPLTEGVRGSPLLALY